MSRARAALLAVAVVATGLAALVGASAARADSHGAYLASLAIAATGIAAIRIATRGEPESE